MVPPQRIQKANEAPLFNFPKDVETKGLNDAYVGKKVLVTDVWASMRGTATKLEQLVVDKIIKSLPKQTTVVIKNCIRVVKTLMYLHMN